MKKILSLILTLFCVLSLVGCGRSMDDIIKNESSITGVVEEVYNNSINAIKLIDNSLKEARRRAFWVRNCRGFEKMRMPSRRSGGSA